MFFLSIMRIYLLYFTFPLYCFLEILSCKTIPNGKLELIVAASIISQICAKLINFRTITKWNARICTHGDERNKMGIETGTIFRAAHRYGETVLPLLRNNSNIEIRFLPSLTLAKGLISIVTRFQSPKQNRQIILCECLAYLSLPHRLF